VVETVISETETWLKLRDRNRDLEVRDRDSSPHVSLMAIKADFLKNFCKKLLGMLPNTKLKVFAVAMLYSKHFANCLDS